MVISDIEGGDKMRERLQKLLEAKGLKTAQFAKLANVSNSTVDDILKGKTNDENVGVDKVLRMAEALDVSVEYLYGRNERLAASNFQLTDTEKEIIAQYRKADEVGRAIVLRSLGIDEKRDNEKMA